LLSLALFAYLLGIIVPLVFTTRPAHARFIGYLASLVAGLAGAVAALDVLRGREIATVELFSVTPYLPVSLGVDALGAWFVLTLSVVGTATAIAALGYARAYDRHGGARLVAVYNLFLATMLLVLILQSVFAFLVAWEAMSLASYLLVVHEHDRRAVRRAGFIYLTMTHVGTALLTAALLVLAGAGHGQDFASLRQGAALLNPDSRAVVFLAALIGFWTKAGLVPLHVWLPRAHPVAPSHVSALMSGVMLKVALYGLVRLAFVVLGVGPRWWGWLLLSLGLLSAVVGVLYALVDRDLKRVLAYSGV